MRSFSLGVVGISALGCVAEAEGFEMAASSALSVANRSRLFVVFVRE